MRGDAGAGAFVPAEARAHAHEILDGDRRARIAAPLRHRCAHGDVDPALARQDAEQRVDHRLGDRMSRQLRRDAVALRIALGNDAAVLHDDHRRGDAGRRARSLGEGGIDRGFQRGVVRLHRFGGRNRAEKRWVCRRRLDRFGQRAAEHQRATAALAINRARGERARDGAAHVLAVTVDVGRERPGDGAHARLRQQFLRERIFRADMRDESGVADCQARRVRRFAEQASRR